mmetsp:Transcript_83633/g.215370  ORF Transcript_83633/g.215370 Transcript_83633/m.215370 type:complete len:201 (+) Transcript_83633:545-1147(+)
MWGSPQKMHMPGWWVVVVIVIVVIVVVVQPLPSWLQHQSFLLEDQSDSQLLNPALQSKGRDVIVVVVAVVVVLVKDVVVAVLVVVVVLLVRLVVIAIALGGGGVVVQPLPALWQHHVFLAVDQPNSQFTKPAVQSKGKDAMTSGGGGATSSAGAGVGGSVTGHGVVVVVVGWWTWGHTAANRPRKRMIAHKATQQHIRAK